jgi:hypothetical protein
MLTRIRRLPSPALVISAIALIVAVGGGTFAFAISDNAKDKKIAKQQANKQITSRAPGLSVSHAENATNATNATNASHADNAANATNAGNADTVGGQPASAFEGKAMWAEVAPDGTILNQSGGISLAHHTSGGQYWFTFPSSVQHSLQVTPVTSAAGDPGGSMDAKAAACGGTAGPTDPYTNCTGNAPNTGSSLFVATFKAGSQTDIAFFITALP